MMKFCLGRKLWTFPRFAGDCGGSGHRKSNSDSIPEIKSDLTDTCSQMILQLHDVYDPNKVTYLLTYTLNQNNYHSKTLLMFVSLIG